MPKAYLDFPRTACYNREKDCHNGGPLMWYLISLVMLLAAYGIGLFFILRLRAPVRYLDVAVTVGILLAHLLVMVLIFLDVGFYDWNFQNTLPTANVSPFIFTLCPIVLILRGRARTLCLTLLSLLSLGMLLAVMRAGLMNYARDYTVLFTILFDSATHAALSLYGIYLVRTGQVTLTRRSCLGAAGILLSAALFMMVLNLCFHTSFFGLSLYGDHNIYTVVLTESGILSALLYFLGLTAVLLGGWLYVRLFQRK